MEVGSAQKACSPSVLSSSLSAAVRASQANTHTLRGARISAKSAILCAGQQQLLALARVLLQQPRLVLLDECDAALDASSAAAVRALLAGQLPDATILQACPGCCVLLRSTRCVTALLSGCSGGLGQSAGSQATCWGLDIM